MLMTLFYLIIIHILRGALHGGKYVVDDSMMNNVDDSLLRGALDGGVDGEEDDEKEEAVESTKDRGAAVVGIILRT